MKIDHSDISEMLKNSEDFGLNHLYKFIVFEEIDGHIVDHSYSVLTNIGIEEIKNIDITTLKPASDPKERISDFMEAVKLIYPETLWGYIRGLSIGLGCINKGEEN